MRIVYDGMVYGWQHHGGINRYFHEVIGRLPADWRPELLAPRRAMECPPEHPQLQVSRRINFRPGRFSERLNHLRWKALCNRADVLHPTYYNLLSGIPWAEIKVPVVVTVLDFAYAAYPSLFDDADVTIAAQREAIRRADRLICISRATEMDLLDRFPEAEKRTTVIHLASSFPVSMVPQPESIYEFPTFLFVGSRGGYKNFLFLLRAFARASQSNPRIRLHLAGPPLASEERWQIHFLGLADKVACSIHPEEADLVRLYERAVALLYPSRHEGFGLPPLEAMSCGTLAVTSNTTSLPEVVGDAGILLDPADEDAWTDCILAVAGQAVPREALLAKGREQAAGFSWDKCAKSHVDLYRELAASGRPGRMKSPSPAVESDLKAV